jgi:hypothetical protein
MEVRRKKAVFCILLLASFAYIWYCNAVMTEVPHLSWFDQLPIADAWFQGRLTWKDLISSYHSGEHGMFANHVLYLLNVIWFQGCTKFDVYLNDLNVVVTGAICMVLSYRMLKQMKSCLFYLAAEALFLFSFVQGSSGAMETQVRLGILSFLITMIFVDRELRECATQSRKHLYAALLLIALSILVFGTLYSFAGVPLVWLLVLITYRRDSKGQKRKLAVAAVYALSVPVYLAEYRIFGFMQDAVQERAGVMQNLGYALAHPVNTLKCLLAWYANGVMGWAYHESGKYTPAGWMLFGVLACTFLVFAVVLFFRCRMYERTWLPLMCIVYSFGVFWLVLLGRETQWEWFSSEWYSVHMKIAYAGAVWIIGYVSGRQKGIWKKLVCTGSVLLLCVCSCMGNYEAVKRAPYVHLYYKNMQKYLFVEDERLMPVDAAGNTPLLDTLDRTMDAIAVLKKYRLSVYKYWDAYENCPGNADKGLGRERDESSNIGRRVRNQNQ